MAKKIIYSEEARKKLFTGFETVAKAVASTLGPGGRLVAIQKDGLVPTLTKDGVTVAKAIDLKDPEENLGAQIIKEAANKTATAAGDNTTTSTVLAYAIAKEGLKSVAAGSRPIELKKGIDLATEKIVKELEKASKEVSSTKDITDVATISANNDPEIGKVLAEAVEKVGKDGVITVEESKNMTTSVKTVNGYQFDNGYISPYFSTDKERMEADFDKSYVLITDKKISSIQDLMPIIEGSAQSGTPLTIICDDMDGDALGTLVFNAIRGTIKVVVVKAPSFGDKRKSILEDIATLTGASIVSDDYGLLLKDTKLENLGTAKIKVTKDTTTITNGAGDEAKIKERVETLKKQVDNLKSDYDKNQVRSRVAKLTGGVAVVSVGAATETELKEKKFRVEDTIAATKAALKEGIIPGGGVALVDASFKVAVPDGLTTDEKIGYNILISAVAEPLRQIAENVGVNGDVVLNNIATENKPGYGFNAKTGKYGDMISSGIIDTTKAIKSALINAASCAGMLLMTECAITTIPEEPKNIQPNIAFN